MGLADHYELAKRLKRMSGQHVQIQAGDPDWDTVMLFYSALHLTSAYLLVVGSGVPKDHAAMARAISVRFELDQRFRGAYKALSEFSWNVRYNPGFVMSQAHKRVAADRFRIVKVFVEATVRDAIGLDPNISEL